MLYTKEQVIKGLTQYIDNEVIARLPTAGKWLAGTVLGLSLKNTQELINYAQDNEVVELLGIFNKDGLIDVDKIVGVAKKNGKFFSDHSEAISGCVVAKSLNPFSNLYPLQYGHLLPPERVEMSVYHSFPQSLHFHQALRLAKTVTCVGSSR